MARAFVGIGSNIDPEKNVKEALRLLDRRVRVRAISTIYQTEPVGRKDQPPFYNGVAEIETGLSPRELKYGVLRRIENELGRERGSDKFDARTIDLDLILYDSLEVSSDELTLPDPELVLRPFLAFPLSELAPELLLPGTGEHMREIASRMTRHGMTPLDKYTEHLRKDVLHERTE